MSFHVTPLVIQGPGAGTFTHTPLLKPKIASYVSCRIVYAKAIRLRISFKAFRSCVSGVWVNGLPLLNASTQL